MTTVDHLPHEVLFAICSFVYAASVPTTDAALDPNIPSDHAVPAAVPSSYPPSIWTEPLARRTLANLCLTSRAWYNAAKPYLWHHVEIRLPRSWLAFVDEVAGDIEDAASSAQENLVDALKTTASPLTSTCDPEALHRSILAQLSAVVPHDSVPVELLTPPASREPSPNRLRAKSPVRWRLLRAVSDAVQSLDPNVYVPAPNDPRPGRHVRHLDFNHFRTIGMRRSVEEGVRSRFVTSQRLESVLKEMPNLEQFGATEYMDGAMNKAVLLELLLRGRALAFKNQNSRGRGAAQEVPAQSSADSLDDEELERLRECKGLESIDLCSCVSSVFVQALDDFVTEYLDDEVDEDGTHTPSQVTIPSVRRLGLRGVTSVPSSILTPFVLAFTSLTHLDLSGTRCAPELLSALADSASVRLTALALARCPRLTAESIVEFLVDGLPARTISQLSLYGDSTFVSQLREADLMRLVTSAPCFRSGRLEYLDLSSTPLTAEVLEAFVPQPALMSLGLSHIPVLPLKTIAAFILAKAKNVEVLTLDSTSPELTGSLPTRQIPVALHCMIIQPLASAPFHFSLTSPSPARPPPTRLRVLELGMATLHTLGGGSDSWRIVRSKGGRGWYVHVASSWVDGVLRRDLPTGHPLRQELERLAASNGNVSSGVGWHARKMEVLNGCGMLGREDGLYGAVSFAYQG